MCNSGVLYRHIECEDKNQGVLFPKYILKNATRVTLFNMINITCKLVAPFFIKGYFYYELL